MPTSSLAYSLIFAGSDINLIYQLDRYLDKLCILCVTWQRTISAITPARPMPSSWGPSEDKLYDTIMTEFHGRWEEREVMEGNGITEEDDCEEDDLDDLDEDETTLIESLEQIALYEGSNTGRADEVPYFGSVPSILVGDPYTSSSRKRGRYLVDD